jgi:O-antigen/teichoic acid export membrane protein
MPRLEPTPLVLLLAVAIALRATYMFTIGVAKGFESFRTTAVIALIATPLNLAMVAIAWWVDAPLEAFLAIFVLSSMVFYWSSTRRVAKLIPPSTPEARLPADLLARVRRHMFISAFMVTVSFVTASDVEVLFLNLLDTASAAGHFKVAHLLASGASILVPGVFSALLLPMMAGALAQGEAVAGRRFVASTNYLTLLAAPVIAFGVVFAGPVIVTLYGVAYEESATAFAALLFAYALTAISSAGSSLLISADRQHTVLMLIAASGTLKIVLDIVLIQRYGFFGAVVAASSALILSAVLMIVLAMRSIGTTLDWARLLRIAFAAIATAAISMPLHFTLPPVQALLSGALVTAIAYPLLTLVLRCWTREDIDHVQAMHARRGSQPRALAALLAWAHDRAPGEPA